HERSARSSHSLPVMRLPRLAGGYGDRGAEVAVGYRNPSRRGRRQRRAHAWHDLERDPSAGKGEGFLPTPTEYERVAALQAHHALALAAQPHQQRLDVALVSAAATGRLADVVARHGRRREGEDLGAHEAVV